MITEPNCLAEASVSFGRGAPKSTSDSRAKPAEQRQGVKTSDAQSKYTVTELELLAIVETLKEFNGMLWGQRITVYTDDKNLT